MKKAIAISQHQGKISWDKVANDNVLHAFSRLGEGETTTDPSFIDNFCNAKQADLLTGAWHIFRAKSSTPQAQAQTITGLLVQAGFAAGDSIAFEVSNSVGNNAKASKEEMADNLQQLIQCVMESDLPIDKQNIYIKTNIDTWNNSVAWERHAVFFKDINLWVENWQKDPVKPKSLCPWGEDNWTFWEFSASESISGIEGNVMVSLINNTADLS